MKKAPCFQWLFGVADPENLEPSERFSSGLGFALTLTPWCVVALQVVL
jgi:hypothetical protein